MSGVERAFRSPLTLLEQWRDRVDGARLREVLITGYTVDLSFLERFAIPTARALGARITVLGDATQAVHDPVDVRRAGVAYQHGHAFCQRAFHPKLVVLLGDEDVWLAIGSGNPTLSGWGYNRELWVVARGSRRHGPQVIADVADWLHDLPDVVTVPGWIAATLRHVAQQMRPAALDDRWSGVRAHGNLRRPLLEQLPTDPVDVLRLSAPFYDPPARAVTALLRRTKPRSVRVAVQPGVGVFDGAALVRAVEDVVDQEFTVLAGGPVRHGKLIEWGTADGSLAGLAGSANVTASALLLSTAQGGNCELAVIAPQDGSLFPEGDPQPGSAVRRLASGQPASTAPGGAGPVLLGCALVEGVLLVELAAPVSAPVLVESSPSAAPGTWLRVGSVPVGQATARFLVPELTGGAIRAVVEVDGVRRESAVVFVTDPSRCRPRRDATDDVRLQRSYEPTQIFADPAIAQRFAVDLDRLVEQVAAARTTTPATTGTRVSERVTPADRWTDFLEDCDRLLGPELARLIFPRSDPSAQGSGIDWSIDDTDQGEVAEDESESVLDDLVDDATEAGKPTVPVVPPDQRLRYQRFAARWVATVAGSAGHGGVRGKPPMPLRMTVAALYLTLLAAAVWQASDDWREDLGRLVEALAPDDDTLDELPPEAFDRLYALLTVAMATLRQGTQLHGGQPADAITTAAWRSAAEWVAEAEAGLAEELLLPDTQPYARVPTVAEVWVTVTLARQTRQDPYAEARTNLLDAGFPVEQRDGLWHVDGDFRNAYRAASLVATELLRVRDQVVVTVRTPARTVLVAVGGQVMALAESHMAVWRTYHLSGTRTPASLTAGHPGPPPGARTHPLTPAPPEVRDLSTTLAVDLTALARQIKLR